jgi:hypothetical protein
MLSKGIVSHMNARATLSNGRILRENGRGTVYIDCLSLCVQENILII